MAPRFTDHIKGLPTTIPFIGPESIERTSGQPFKARIGANESVFGPSPNAVAAMEKAASENWKYPDPESHDLRHSLSEHLGVSPDNLIIGEGIDGLLGVALRLLVEPGIQAVMPDGAYPTFAKHVQNLGGSLVTVPYVDDKESIDDLLATAQQSRAPILYFTNPDNPMGTFWERSEVERMIGQLPDETALFLDEAYCEFAPKDSLPMMDVSNPMVIRFRTFSKAYGLAGARIGYVIAHEDVIAAMNKIRNQYGINRIGQIGALAALNDPGWLAEVCEKTASGREQIYKIAEANQLTPIQSMANFVTIDCGKDVVFAKKVLDGLVEQGIFVRMPFAAPGNRCIRVGVGSMRDIALFAGALPAALEKAKSSIS